MNVSRTLWLVAACAAAPALAAWTDEKAWQEIEATPPAQFRTDRLVEFQMSPGSELRFGIAPETLTVGADGVVRYVLVARSASGVSNTLYQGLRCDVGQFRTYAVWQDGLGWRTQTGDWTDWLKVATGLPARRLAREAFCEGRTVNTPVSRMLDDLRQGKRETR